jgi:hypothetical protein
MEVSLAAGPNSPHGNMGTAEGTMGDSVLMSLVQ